MTCKVKDCKNSANHRTQYPTQEQKHFFKAREHRYYICDECEDEGWKYNCIDDEYYFSPPKAIKITILKKDENGCPFNEPLHNHHDGCPACIDQSWQDWWDEVR